MKKLYLELDEGELGLPGLLVDKVVIVLGRDVERVALLGVELGGVQDQCDLTLGEEEGSNLKIQRI